MSSPSRSHTVLSPNSHAASGHADVMAAPSVSMPQLADLGLQANLRRIPATVLSSSVRTIEFALIAATGLVIAHLYVNEPGIVTDPWYLAMVALTASATLGVSEIMGLYRASKFTTVFAQLPRLALAWTVAFAVLTLAIFLTKAGSELSRVWLAIWFIVGGGVLMSSRIALAGLARHWTHQGRLYRRAAIYGSGDMTGEVIRQLESDAGGDLRIAGLFDDREDGRAAETVAGYPRLGGIGQLVNFARTANVDLIIVALPIAAEQRLAQVLKHLSVLPADIKLPAGASGLRFSPRTYSNIGNVAMIDVSDKPIADWDAITKSCFDKIVGAVALVLLAPVMAAVAAAIKFDSRGPMLFKQKRYGFNNELIEVFKFRSMYTDMSDANAAKLVTKDDPRVTPVGRFIRKTSLDELPQLFNVLRGDLSLVGPRPHALQAKAADRLYDDVVDDYFARHKVKPGITGWAQVCGWRGETDTAEKIQKRVEHDLYYIENWSVFFDIYILVKTPFALLNTKSAY